MSALPPFSCIASLPNPISSRRPGRTRSFHSFRHSGCLLHGPHATTHAKEMQTARQKQPSFAFFFFSLFSCALCARCWQWLTVSPYMRSLALAAARQQRARSSDASRRRDILFWRFVRLLLFQSTNEILGVKQKKKRALYCVQIALRAAMHVGVKGRGSERHGRRPRSSTTKQEERITHPCPCFPCLRSSVDYACRSQVAATMASTRCGQEKKKSEAGDHTVTFIVPSTSFFLSLVSTPPPSLSPAGRRCSSRSAHCALESLFALDSSHVGPCRSTTAFGPSSLPTPFLLSFPLP